MANQATFAADTNATARATSAAVREQNASPAHPAAQVVPASYPSIQPKLKVGSPDDQYEREADEIAQQVTTAPSQSAAAAQAGGATVVEEPKKRIYRKPLAASISLLQRKLAQNTLSVPVTTASAPKKKAEEEVQAKGEEEEINPVLAQRMPEQDSEEKPQSVEEESQLKVQRQEEEEPETVQAKLETEGPEEAVQAKLEEEKDQVEQVQAKQEEEEQAEQVQAKAAEEEPEAPVQRQEEANEAVQLKPTEEEAEEPAGAEAEAPQVQPKLTGAKTLQPDTMQQLEHQLNASKSGGMPLPATVQADMATGFGADFSNVRIHTDAQAAQLARSLHAQAFTHQHHVFFGEGKFAPETQEGKVLLAHELTHTVQQGAVQVVTPTEEVPEVVPDPQLQLQAEVGEEAATEIELVPQLLEAIRLARAEMGKVDAKKVDDDGTRHGWQQLWEYFQTAFGNNPTVSEDVIKHVRKVNGADAMPSWCGIFIWWAYKKAGIPIVDWRFGGGQVKELELFPTSRVPQPGDIAYRNNKSHYALVSDVTEAPPGSSRSTWMVTTLNGNTTGSNNLGGQIEEKKEPIGGRWDGFFNPLTGLDFKKEKVKITELREAAGTGETATETPTPETAPEQAPEAGSATEAGDTAAAGEVEVADEAAITPDAVAVEDPDLLNDPRLAQPAGAGAEEAAAVEALTFEGKSEDMVSSLTTATPSQMAASYGSLGSAVTAGLAKEQTETASQVPDLAAQNAGVAEQLEEKVPLPEQTATAEIADGETGADAPKLELPEHTYAAPPPENKKKMEEKERNLGLGFWDWLKSNFFGNIQTKDPNISTSAGERPVVDTTGDADPNRSNIQKEDADTQVTEEKNAIQQQLKDNPGQDNIQPVLVDEQYPVAMDTEKTEQVETPDEQPLNDYAGAELPEEVRNAADAKLSTSLDPKLEKQRTEVAEAARQRDENKEQAIQDAQQEADEMGQESAKAQVKTVKDNRAKVVADQQKGIQESQDKLNAYKDEARKEKTNTDKDVVDRINTDNKEAASKLNKAEEEAEKKKTEGENEAETIRKEEKKKNEERSWWDRAKDAVKSVVKFVTEAIDKVFNKIRQAIKDVIDFAKNAVIGLIEAGRKWIVDKLDKFRNWLKDKVSKYLKDFPGIANAINKAIDKTVDGAIKVVNKTAEALKKGVEFLADKLGKFLDKILAAFQAGLKAAVQIVGAILTGDFTEALKIAFMAACEIAGIDPNPILDFLNRVGKFLIDVFKSPLKFLRNVGLGIQGGLRQFLNKIMKHLLGGVIAWLTGALSEAKIQLPDTFDLKGIFSLVAQILGVTYQNIRAKVIKKLGPKGAQVIETLEKTLDFVIVLVTKGPMGVWEMIKEKLADLKETVINEITKWLSITVVKEGIIWLLSLTNPASALVKAIKMIFDVVMFLVERFEQIKDFVLSVYNTLVEIVQGNVQKVADAIENTIARTIPVIIGFMASLLGLGGIGKAVTNVIRKVSKPVQKAIDFVVTKIVNAGKKLLKSVKAGAKKVKEAVGKWLKMRKSFTSKAGKKHQVYFKKQGKGAQLIMESTPMPVKTFLSKRSTEIAKDTSLDAAQKAALTAKVTEAQNLIAKQEKLIYAVDRNAKPDDSIELEILATSESIVAILKELDLDGDKKPIPPAVYNPGFTNGLRGQFFDAKYIADHPEKNYEPGEKADKYNGTLSGALPLLESMGVSSKWVAFHIVNDNYGGKATDSNLVPTPQIINKEYRASFEDKLKAHLKKKNPVWMKFTSTYRGNTPFLETITANGGAMKFDGKEWVEDPNNKVNTYATKVDKPIVESIDVNNLVKDNVLWSFYEKETPLFIKELDFLASEVAKGNKFKDKDDILARAEAHFKPKIASEKTKLENRIKKTNFKEPM